MNKNKLKNKKILITGINGFIGSQLHKRLLEMNADVYGISRSCKTNNKIIKANILDYQVINKFIKDSNIEICFHLASESLVEKGQINPRETFEINIEGAINIFESARENNLERVIISSTSHIYGKNQVPYLESYNPKPTRPYETSKACVDLIAQSYINTYNLPVLIPRFVNIYGPGDLNFQRLIPKTIKNVLKNYSPEMWGGDITRDYLFIDDAINAYIDIACIDLKKVGTSTIFNFGSSNIITVENLIKKIIRISGMNLNIEEKFQEREGEIDEQYVSFSKAKKILKWNPTTNLNVGLQSTIKWYLRYFNSLGK